MPRAEGRLRRWRGWSVRLALLALSLVPTHRARAQGGVLLQGILDGEFWATDSSSRLLTRNNGHPAGLARLETWAAAEPWAGVVLYAQSQVEGGPAQPESRTELYLDQIGVRYTRAPALVVDVGKMPQIVGTFAPRRFSTRNPLIVIPDGYPLQYPVGAQVSGATRHFDYRVAMLSLPVSHPGYTPDPSAAYRPAAGGGYTPFVGARIGASFTRGPYLGEYIAPSLLAGKSWESYRQTITALDAQFARGYLETRAEYGRGTYQIPGRPDVTGTTYYVEAKYTFTPRFFVAARGERNDYPFIRPPADSTGSWTSVLTDFSDGEVGAGLRLTASTLLKTSLRLDDWKRSYRYPDGIHGHAFAVQVSQSFDVMDWVDRRR